MLLDSRLSSLKYLLCAFVLLCPPAFADVTESEIRSREAQLEEVLNGVQWLDGASFIERLYNNLLKLNDYQVDSNIHASDRGKMKHGGGRLYFKRNKRLRLEVSSGGLNNGAIVVRQEDGRLRACGGGALSFMKMNLDEDSRMLKLPNGYSVAKGDYASLLSIVRERVARGESSKITAKPIGKDLYPFPVAVLDIKRDGMIVDRILINTTNEIPVEWNVFRSGKMSSITLFKNFRPNTGLKDNLFVL